MKNTTTTTSEAPVVSPPNPTPETDVATEEKAGIKEACDALYAEFYAEFDDPVTSDDNKNTTTQN